jgi:type IV pilus assembly protein PilM
LFGFAKKGKRLIGLDIGASAVKLLSGDFAGSKFTVRSLAIQPLPYRAIDERGIQDSASVQNAVAAAFQKMNGESPDCAASIHGSGVLTKRIVMPKIPKKEIPEQVRWEAEQVFPQDVAGILVDHLLLGEADQLPNAPKGTKGWDLLLVGVHQNDVITVKSMVENSRGTVKVVDLDAFASGDLLDTALGLNKKKYNALVDVGATSTRVSVRYQGNSVFIREFPLGGNAFTETIAQNLGLSFEDAEALKVQGSEGGTFPEEAKNSVDSLLGQWKAELQQCEDIFISQESDALVSSWHLYGGASQTPGLLESLRDDRFGNKAKSVPSSKILKAGGKGVDKELMNVWASRLITAAGLGCRKG